MRLKCRNSLGIQVSIASTSKEGCRKRRKLEGLSETTPLHHLFRDRRDGLPRPKSFPRYLEMFKAIVWNIRGVRNKATRNHFLALNRKHNTDLLAILEPKIDGDNLPSLASELHMSHFFHGGDGNKYILLMWKDSIHLNISDIHPQFLTCTIRDQASAQETVFAAVYASCSRSIRRELWQALSDFYMNCDQL